MEPSITVALIGGTGKAGKYLLQHLLAQNIAVKMLHRKPDTVQTVHPLLCIVRGDARNGDDIVQLLQNCTTVISCLGQPTGEPPIFSTATGHILNAMSTQGIRRYILLAGLNVDTPTDRKGAYAHTATNWMKKHYPESCADRQREYGLLVDSSVDWTLVRIPLLKQTDELIHVAVDSSDCPGQHISSASLAKFMCDQTADKRYVRQAPFLANS